MCAGQHGVDEVYAFFYGFGCAACILDVEDLEVVTFRQVATAQTGFDLVVAAHWFTHGNGAGGDFVAWRDQAFDGDAFDNGSTEELGACDQDVVGGVEANVGIHGLLVTC